jgi:alpha-1,2-glucosyltransferase
MFLSTLPESKKQADHRPRYLVAKFFEPLFGCDTSTLRWLNAVALCLVCPLSYQILRMLRTPVKQAQQDPRTGNAKTAEDQLKADDQTLVLDTHSALNIALFPPLFFFSALYYTDVMSTLAALLSFGVFLRKKTAAGSLFDNVSAVLVGVVALFFRQTNIFWVAVFPAGLTVIEALKITKPSSDIRSERTSLAIIQESWSQGTIYDCPVEEAGFEGSSPFAVCSTNTN